MPNDLSNSNVNASPTDSLTTDSLTITFHTLDYPPDDVVSSVGYYTHSLAHALADKGHKVHVICRGVRDERIEEGAVSVHRLSPPRVDIPTKMDLLATLKIGLGGFWGEFRFRQKLAKKVSELIKQEGVQIFEAVDSAAESLFYPVKKYSQVAFINRLHGPTAVWELFDRNAPEFARRVIWWLEHITLSKTTHLSTPSSAGEAIFRREMKLGNKAIDVFPNPPSFTINESSIEARQGEEGDVDLDRVLFVGRITQFKGVDRLIEAIPAVLDAHPSARFVFVGPDSPTPKAFASTQNYLWHILPEKYHHAVEFTGYKQHDEVAAYYQKAAFCVFPSMFDNFPYTCLEAMSFAKAIIGSSEGGMLDMLDKGQCGLLYTPPDTAQLSHLILKLLREPDLCKELGQKAQQRVLSEYNLARVVEYTEAFYYRAIGELARVQPANPVKPSNIPTNR